MLYAFWWVVFCKYKKTTTVPGCSSHICALSQKKCAMLGYYLLVRTVDPSSLGWRKQLVWFSYSREHTLSLGTTRGYTTQCT